jgi:LysM repeat protein
MRTSKFYRPFLISSFIFHLSFFAFAQDYSLSSKDTAEVRFLNQRKFFIYKVDKGETLYSISKKFNVPQEEITEFNSELKAGLKVKMKLWIPAASYLKKEEAKVMEKEVNNENVIYQVAFMINFSIPKNISVDPSLVDTNVVGESLSEETIANLEFYEGALLAIDSLEKSKLKVHLFVYDTENDSMKTIDLLKNPDLKKMDLIISNGNVMITKLINDFSIQNHVKFATSVLNAGDIIANNKEAISMYPSSLTQCKEAGKIAAGLFNDYNCIALKTALTKENERSIAFKKGWSASTEKKVKDLDYTISAVSVLKENMSARLNNLIFVPSTSEDFVSSIVNDLKELSEEYKITLIGLPTWQYFETIDPLLLELLDVHIFTSSFVHYNYPSAINFRKNFYDTYNTEPTDVAFEGFDVMMVLGSNLAKYGTKFEEHLASQTYNGLYSSYRFETSAENPFVENHYISLCKYKNYELKKVNE